MIFFLRSEVLLGNANLSLTDKEGNTALHLPCSKVSDHKGVFCGLLWFQKGEGHFKKFVVIQKKVFNFYVSQCHIDKQRQIQCIK